jgi:hypothetical protein
MAMINKHSQIRFSEIKVLLKGLILSFIIFLPVIPPMMYIVASKITICKTIERGEIEALLNIFL